MKICLAQIESLKGNVSKNIQNHLQVIEQAIKLKSDLIIFPELSITGYEPTLAKELATTAEDNLFNPFQELSNSHEITIGVGVPTKATKGINISILLFQPHKKREVYAKQLLHADELPFFVAGQKQTILKIKGKNIAFGICYESLHRKHFLNAVESGADIYIASVAKPKSGIQKAYLHFPKMANEFNTPILMANCVGFYDNFWSVGQSAIWNKKGILLKHLDNKNQGILIYDTELESNELLN